MTVPFSNIPANVRVPLFYAEVDNSQASYFEQNNRTLLIGQKVAVGTAAANAPVLVARTDEAKALFGEGSMLARMHEVYRKNDDFGEVWCIPLVDDAAGVAATGTVTVTGPATEAGTLSLYIAGQCVRVGVAKDDAAATIAAALVTAIAAMPSLPVTAAAAAAAVVTLTAKWKGATGNDITLVPNLRGSAGGEKFPAGVGLNIVAMANGAANPAVSGAIAAMGDEEYDHVIIGGYTDSATLDAFKSEFDDATGRWAWSRQIYGHVYTARRGTLGQQVAFGVTRNDWHATVADMEPEVPQPAWEMAAAYGAQNARALNDAPHRPTQTLELKGIIPAPAGKRRTLTEKQSLLFAGIATTFVGGGTLRVERAVTSYQLNAWNQPDPSYLDINTPFQLSFIIRFLRQRVTQKYGRHALSNDGKRIGPGVVTPNIIRAELVAAYDELERAGIVENAEAFAKALVVERDGTNPNRINVLYPPDLVNQLRIFAVLAQFRLQFSDAA